MWLAQPARKAKIHTQVSMRSYCAYSIEYIILIVCDFEEAHDLINQWVADKIRLDMDDELFEYADVSEMTRFASNQKILDELKSKAATSSSSSKVDTAGNNESVLDIKGVDYDKYDEAYIAKDVIGRLMRKQIVDPSRLGGADYGDDEKTKRALNTHMRIEIRHKLVKENRDERQRQLEETRRQRLARRQVELDAKQIVQREEEEKRRRREIEQQLIEHEAQRLRVEMAEQRRRDDEARHKLREAEALREERERQETLNIRHRLDMHAAESALQAKRVEMAQRRAEDVADAYLKTKAMRVCLLFHLINVNLKVLSQRISFTFLKRNDIDVFI